MTMNMQEVDLRKITEDVLDELKCFAKANNVDLKMEAEGKIELVKTDPVRIKMVVENFIDNAIKYAKDGEGKIVIKLKGEEGKVYCGVQDDGIGITLADQKKIFEKFFRGREVSPAADHRFRDSGSISPRQPFESSGRCDRFQLGGRQGERILVHHAGAGCGSGGSEIFSCDKRVRIIK